MEEKKELFPKETKIQDQTSTSGNPTSEDKRLEEAATKMAEPEPEPEQLPDADEARNILRQIKEENKRHEELLKFAVENKMTDILGGKSQASIVPAKESPEDKVKREANEYLRGTGLSI